MKRHLLPLAPCMPTTWVGSGITSRVVAAKRTDDPRIQF